MHHPPPPKPLVLETKPVTIRVSVPPGEISDAATRSRAVTRLLNSLERQLAGRGLQSKRAGFVIAFAQGPVTGISQAEAEARTALKVISKKESSFSSATGVGYWMGGGDFEFKIFFFA